MDADFPLLAALAVSPANAHRLLRELERAGVPASRSTVYRRVEALLAAGLLEAQEGRRPGGGPGRPVRSLRLTPQGLRLAADEAMDAVEHAPISTPRFLLALACAAVLHEPDLAPVLRRRIAEARMLREEEEQALGRPAVPAWRAAEIRRRLAHLDADIRWLEEMHAQALEGKGTDQRTA
jgi:hypothetical protein